MRRGPLGAEVVVVFGALRRRLDECGHGVGVMLGVSEMTMIAYIGAGVGISIWQLALIAAGLLVLALLAWRVTRRK